MSSNDPKSGRYSTRRGAAAAAAANSSSSTSNSSSSAATAAAAGSGRPQRSTRAAANAKPVVIDESSSSSFSGDEDIKVSKQSPRKRATAGRASAAAAASSKIDPEAVASLEAITSLSRAECLVLLEAAQGSVDKAVELHFGGGGGGTSSGGGAKPKTSLRTNGESNGFASASMSSVKNANNKRPITNNFDEESSSSSSSSSRSHSSVQAINQGGDGEDEVRAPIPQKSEKLIDYDPYALSVEPKTKRIKSVFDGYDHYNEMTQESGAASSSNSSKLKSLAALYRPPIELLFRGSFDASKIQGTKTNKWIILNVQNQNDFACQCLNRDLWRDDTVKEIVKGNFIFVQIYSDSIEGKRLENLYRITRYPFVAILDPRTGENVHQFNTSKLDEMSFCEKVTNFLCEHGEAPAADFEPAAQEDEQKQQPRAAEKSTTNGLVDRRPASVVVIDEDEEEEEEANIKRPLRKEKASEAVKHLEKSTTSDDEEKSTPRKRVKVLDSTDSSSPGVSPSKTNGLSPSKDNNQVKDCLIRVMLPNGERFDYSTNGDRAFRTLVDELRSRGYKKRSYELIERLMPVSSSSNNPNPVVAASSSSQISNELSNLAITAPPLSNHSRNLFSLADPTQTFKQLQLYPRVFLLLQEIQSD